MHNIGPNQFLIQHDSIFEHDQPARGCMMLTRLKPRDDRGQRLLDFTITTDPRSTPTPYRDNFSNRGHLISINRMFNCANIRTCSIVRTADGTDIDGWAGRVSWEELQHRELKILHWPYLVPSKFVRVGKTLREFAIRNGLERGGCPLATLQFACTRLNECIDYVPGSTRIETPLEHILETGKGVCQDFAHVMLALGRSWGIPCRYVSGYIYLENGDGNLSLETASHAWAEFWIPGPGWIGLDPTNNTVVDRRYVRIAHGRDYEDAAPTRGIVFDGGDATVKAVVNMERFDDDADSEDFDWPDTGNAPEVTSPWIGGNEPPSRYHGNDQ